MEPLRAFDPIRILRQLHADGVEFGRCMPSKRDCAIRRKARPSVTPSWRNAPKRSPSPMRLFSCARSKT